MTQPASPTAKKVQIGMCSMYPAPGIIERIGPDWDWVWIDGQHGQSAGYSEMLSMVRACNLVGKPAYVRVPSHETAWISLALDANAAGVIVPQVESAAEAAQVVKAAKFPPLGNRSYGGRRPIDFHGRNYSNTANADLKLICQIESEEALAAAEEIAGTPGVDALFLGPDDMMLRKGLAMDQPRSKAVMAECITTMVAACRQHGRSAFTVAMDEEMISLCVSLGVDCLVCGGDVPFLANSSKAASQRAREVIARTPEHSAPAAEGTLQPKTIY